MQLVDKDFVEIFPTRLELSDERKDTHSLHLLSDEGAKMLLFRSSNTVVEP